MELKGCVRMFPVYGRPRIVSPVATWKPDTIFHFWAQIPMYAGCSGAAYVYACCIIGKVRTCGKNVFLPLGSAKRGEKSA